MRYVRRDATVEAELIPAGSHTTVFGHTFAPKEDFYAVETLEGTRLLVQGGEFLAKYAPLPPEAPQDSSLPVRILEMYIQRNIVSEPTKPKPKRPVSKRAKGHAES